MNILDFDATKYKLGKLCKRGHDWNGTGQSLRRLSDNYCVGCSRLKRLRSYHSKPKPNKRDPEKRFYSRFEETEGCWLWKGSKAKDGYGRFMINNKHVLAHRFSYELHYGSIPSGMQICHHCDTPLCIRPDHLFLGTIADNLSDMVAKGRQAKGEKNNNAKFTEQDIYDIRARYVRDSKQHGTVAIARDYNVTPCTINNIVHRMTWKHII